jgi:NTE family protein
MNNPNGPKLSLVLGGGGARGLAHIGVLQVLEKAGLSPTFLTGTSMGGLVGALYAAGWTAEQLKAEAIKMTSLRSLVRLVDLAPARRGLLEGQRIRDQLGKWLGEDLTFDQLKISLALIAVDLYTSQVVVLRQGSVVQSVLATMAVPGLFAPVPMNKCQLVDGGILNNLPVDVAQASGDGPVIAVDVSPSFPLHSPDRVDDEDNLWPAVFPHFAQDFYTAELIMVNALTSARLEQAPPDFLLQPPIPPSISIFWGFTQAQEAIAAGEKAAWQALPAIEKLMDKFTTSS